MRCAVILTVIALFLSGCASTPPTKKHNLCHIFSEKSGWFDDAADAAEKWGTSIPVLMAILHQESRFVANAKPKRKRYLGFIPGPRPSSAYGYSQATDGAWQSYKKSTDQFWVSRDDFEDSVDFLGWYNRQSYKKCGIKRNDTYQLYLAYHEGHGGYNRRSFQHKQWLLNVAAKVSRRAQQYDSQLRSCAHKFSRSWF